MSIKPHPTTFDGQRAIPSKDVTHIMYLLLRPTSEDKLLEIGTGSGYQTELFAESGAEVHSVELEPWVDPTKVVGPCVFLHGGNGRYGLAEEAPFSMIVATCAVDEIPDAWCDQLSEGGRLVVPVGDSTCQKLTLFEKRNGQLEPRRVAAYVKFQMLRDKPRVKVMKPVYAER